MYKAANKSIFINLYLTEAQVDQRPQHEPGTLYLIEEKVGNGLKRVGIVVNFLNKILIAQAIKDYMKWKSFCKQRKL